MKTLDEVIDSITRQSGLEIRNARKPEKDRFWVDRETYNDALYYLREYRSDQIEWNANRKAWNLAEEDLINTRMKYITKLKELDIGTLNEPLTWDELKTMEGKPVWVEVLRYAEDHYKWEGRWMLIRDFTRGVFGEYCHMEPNYRTWINTSYGDLWQAYRKERW